MLKLDAWDEDKYQVYLDGLKSPLRKYVINTILPMVIESSYDGKKNKSDPRFHRLGLWNEKSKGTSCGLLPHFVLDQLGAAKGFGYPVQGLRDVAEKIQADPEALKKKKDQGITVRGVWVDTDQDIYADDEIRPLPGDIYGLAVVTDPKNVPQHVGVIVDPRQRARNEWITADAGQGGRPDQAALYCPRLYNAEKGTLSGPRFRDPTKSTPTEQGEPRTLAGWIDIELLMLSPQVRQLTGR